MALALKGITSQALFSDLMGILKRLESEQDLLIEGSDELIGALAKYKEALEAKLKKLD